MSLCRSREAIKTWVTLSQLAACSYWARAADELSMNQAMRAIMMRMLGLPALILPISLGFEMPVFGLSFLMLS